MLIGLVVLFCIVPAMAHRLTIFAWMEGETLISESTFGRGGKLKGGSVELRDAETGKLLLTGVTDAEGVFRCTLPESIRTSGHDVLIVALGGEGHRGEWTVKSEEWKASIEKGNARAQQHASTVSNGAPSSVAAVPSALSGVGSLSAGELEQLLGSVLEAKLAPLRRELAALRSGTPGVKEVVGGLGWIIGLFGMFAWCRSKKER